MTRKKLLVLISILFVLIAAILVGGYFYLTTTQKMEEEPIVESTGSLAETGEVSTGGEEEEPIIEPGVITKLRHLTTTPVAGYDFIETKNGYVVWYVDRATGNIFQAATSTTDISRITNTTIPKVYEAFVGKGGATVVLRTLNETSGAIQTFIGTPKAKTGAATSTDTTKELVGVFTGDTINTFSFAPTKDKFFGMTGSASGLGNIYTLNAKSTNVFSHPLKKWVPQWVNGSTVVLTSAPSAKTQNISYFLNPTTKAFTKLLGPKNGLVVSSSPDASRVIFSENKGDSLAFGIYTPKTGAETSVSTGTIPDKCVWSKKDTSMVYCGFPKATGGIFPDDWYQGKIFFDDTIRALDTNTLQFSTISDLASARTEIDATNLMLSSDDKYLLFTNKRDLTLWMLEI